MNARIVEQTQKMLSPETKWMASRRIKCETCTSFRTNALQMIRFCGLIVSAAIYFYAHSGNVRQCLLDIPMPSARVPLPLMVDPSYRADNPLSGHSANCVALGQAIHLGNWLIEFVVSVACTTAVERFRWLGSHGTIFVPFQFALILVHRIASVYCVCWCWFN